MSDTVNTRISINKPDYTCPCCDIPQGQDYVSGLGANRMALQAGEVQVSFDLCNRCFNKIDGMAFLNRQKALKKIVNRVSKRPGDYIRQSNTFEVTQ